MWPHLYLAGSAEGGRRGITVEVVLLQLEHGSGEMMEVARSSTIEVAGPETLMQAICNALPQASRVLHCTVVTPRNLAASAGSLRRLQHYSRRINQPSLQDIVAAMADDLKCYSGDAQVSLSTPWGAFLVLAWGLRFLWNVSL